MPRLMSFGRRKQKIVSTHLDRGELGSVSAEEVFARIERQLAK